MIIYNYHAPKLHQKLLTTKKNRKNFILKVKNILKLL